MRPLPIAAAAVAALLLAPDPLSAQDPEPAPPPPVVIPIPDEELPADTFPSDAVQAASTLDTIGPAPSFPSFPDPSPAGYAHGVWEFDRDALRSYHGFSLVELLERIPGLVLTRTGGFGMPLGTSFLGMGGARVRIVLDGYEYDPLDAPTHDLQRLDLVDVAHLRVRRRPDEILLEIDRHRLEDATPFTEVEAGTGDFRSRILRAYFTRPVLARNVLTVGLDIVDTSGQQGLQPFSATTGFARLDHAFTPDLGLQLEYRQRGDDLETLFPESVSRRDLVVRGRSRLAGGISADLTAGWAQWRDRADPPVVDGEEQPATPDRATVQLGGRAAWERERIWARAGARIRPGDADGLAPSRDVGLDGGLRLPGIGEVDAELRHAVQDGAGGLQGSGGARIGPWLGFSAFARMGGGTRGVARWLPDPADPTTDDGTPEGGPLDAPSGVGAREVGSSWRRAGAEWRGWGVHLAGAAFHSAADSILPYGLAFDREAPARDGSSISGYELLARTPLFHPRATLEGWYVAVPEALRRPYLPQHQWRGAFRFHGVFREGNFEPTFLAELHGRGAAATPDRGDGGAIVGPYTLMRASLQLRIIDVRAFATVENVLFRGGIQDVPGFDQPVLMRAIFGARWQFFN